MFRTTLVLALLIPAIASAQTREEKVRGDREKVTAEGFWIYNDLPAAFAQAKTENKPMIVVLRCIPCEECVKLDDDLVDQDPVLRPLLKQFVRARQVSTNGLDLDLFQYDTDQSFAVFLLNADGTIYSRFGTRSHRTEWYGDVSIEGLAAAMDEVLKLHKSYPINKSLFAGKRGEPLEFKSPELYPHLKDKFTDQLNYKGNVVKSCIHCHQIGDARRVYYRDQGKPIPENILFPYPHPKVVGLKMAPDQAGIVTESIADSAAQKAGLTAGDRIHTMNRQIILSIADVQWVLDRVDPAGGNVDVIFQRDGQRQKTQLSLADGWRRADDISWRVSSWPYRRMVTGGMLLEPLDDEKRSVLNIPKNLMALRVKHVGQYGPHAAAKKAGIKPDDIVIQYDGQSDLMTDGQLLAHGLNSHQVGDKIEVTVLRGKQRKTVTLPIQE
ncbi:MAG: Trx7/PDZ domain-containing (seleno)protein [Pirellulaceae bacterium]